MDHWEKGRTFLQGVKGNLERIRFRLFFHHPDGKARPYLKAIHETADLIVAQLQGPIDARTVPRVYADFHGKLERYLDKHILLDFKGVTDVDTSTVADLISLLNQLQQRHRKFGIMNVSTTLGNYIRIDKLGSVIRIYKDEEEALKDFGVSGSAEADGHARV